jgi:8-oxo-dGTP pyrophosphatase MutT (NUDIX family)
MDRVARQPQRVIDRRADLLRLLTGYRAGDEAEERSRLAVLDLVAAAHDPFDRRSYAPGHVTASGWVIHPEGDRILLIHHAKLDIWVQPGGHVDPDDDDLVAAARREIAEETGLTDLEPVGGIVDVDVHAFPARGEQPDHHHFDVRYAFVSRTAELDHNDEVHDARWVGLDDLAGLGVDESVVRPARKLLG